MLKILLSEQMFFLLYGHPDVTKSVDCNVKHQNKRTNEGKRNETKQTNKQINTSTKSQNQKTYLL